MVSVSTREVKRTRKAALTAKKVKKKVQELTKKRSFSRMAIRSLGPLARCRGALFASGQLPILEPITAEAAFFFHALELCQPRSAPRSRQVSLQIQEEGEFSGVAAWHRVDSSRLESCLEVPPRPRRRTNCRTPRPPRRCRLPTKAVAQARASARGVDVPRGPVPRLPLLNSFESVTSP